MTDTKQMSESIPIYMILALSGGCMDAYSYLNRGRVFANAQTGNMLLFGVNCADRNISDALRYLWPVLAFAAGIMLSDLIRYKIQPQRDGRPLFGMLAAPGSEFTCQCPHILCLRASGRELPFRPRKCHGHHYVHWQSQKRNLLSRPVFSEPERSMDTQGRAVLWNDPVFRPGCCGGKLPDPAVCRKSHPALSLSSDDGISPYAVPPGHSVAAAVMMWCSSSSTGSRILPPSPPARPYLYPSDNPPVWPLTGWILVRS